MEGAPGRCQDVGEGKRDLIARFQFLTFLLGEAEVAVARLAVMPLLVVSFSSLFFLPLTDRTSARLPPNVKVETPAQSTCPSLLTVSNSHPNISLFCGMSSITYQVSSFLTLKLDFSCLVSIVSYWRAFVGRRPRNPAAGASCELDISTEPLPYQQ